MGISGAVLVTGSSSGVGAAVVERLRSDDHRVVCVDIAPPERDDVEYLEADLSDPAAIDGLVAEAPADLRSLVNVAGVPGTLPAATVLAVNFLGLRHLTESLLDRLTAGSTIVNVGSISGNAWSERLSTHQSLLATSSFADGAAWWADRGRSVGVDPYSFSKEAVIVYSMQLAARLLGTGVRVNEVSPGPVDTPLLPTFREQIGDDRLDWVISHAGRAAQPDEIAQAICWLAVGESDWVNGQHLVVDGGYSGGLLSGSIDATNAPQPKQTFVD